MERMTITEALVQLKMYDKKISKKISSADFIGTAKDSSSCIGHQTKQSYAENAVSQYDSIMACIKNSYEIKKAVVRSNTATMVKVGSEEMSVAEAIEMKNRIEYEKELLNKMEKQLSTAKEKMTLENMRVQANIDRLLESFVSKDSTKKITQEEQDGIRIPYENQNKFSLVDPISIEEKIKYLKDRIDDFCSNVDVALVLSNSTTFIEVDLS